MSSEIRASSALTLPVTQAGSAELSIQNPLFSIDSPGGFPQVLKQQADAREDGRRNAVADQAARRQKSSSSRHEKQDELRQATGKRLPARQPPAQARESTTERPASGKASKVADRDEVSNQASPVVQAPHQQSAAADSTAHAEDGAFRAAAVPAEQGLVQSADEDALLASGEEASLLAAAELKPVVGEMLPGDTGATASGEHSESDQAIDLALVSAQMVEGQSLEQAALTSEVASVNVDPAVSMEEGVSDPALLAADADATPLQAAVLAGQTVAPNTQVATTGAGGSTASSQFPGATQSSGSQSSATQSAGAVQLDVKSASQGGNPSSDQTQTAPAGELEGWELGHEASLAEKNAEARSEFAKQLAADRTGPLKDQLAALAQQFKGAVEGETKPQSRKADTTSEIKPTVFGRTLEQLSNARVDSGKPVSTGIQTPVGHREWAGELGQRLVMMVSSKLKSAEIHLNPKDLGPVEVRIRMHEDKAHVVFTSQVAQTREVLEQSVPRLREMLDQNGVALGNVDVQDHGARHSRHQQEASDGSRGRDGATAGSADSTEENNLQPVRAVGLVDYYA